MRAILCRSPGQLELVDRPMPQTGPGEVLVRIRRVGICGTDMHIYQGNQPYFAYPRVMGHELSGEIAEASSDSKFKQGDAVYIVPYLSCGHCIACRAGRTNCCTNTCGICMRDIAFSGRVARRQHHAQRHRLAMQ